MERSPVRTMRLGWNREMAWTLFSQVLPAVAFALAAFLLLRGFTEGGAHPSSSASVDPEHAARLAANISFFETRVAETKDSLSYNRLTGLYLQRLRETGDASDVRRAEISAQRSLDAAPGEYSGLFSMAQVRIAQHDFEAAAALARQAIDLIPTRPDAKAVLGDALMALGKYDEARASYQQFLDAAPGSPAFARRAALAEIEGQTAIAEQFWQAAIDADRSDAPESSAWARVQLGTLYFATGRIDRANDEFATALEVFPRYGAAQAGLARVAAARGENEKAIALYQAAITSLPLPDYAIALGELFQRMGRQRDAEQQFALVGAIEQLYEANGIRNDITTILFDADQGKDPEATLERARAAYDARPALAAADAYGWALFRAGHLDEARARAEEALRLGTRDPLYSFHAGAIAFAQGDMTAATEYLNDVATLNKRFSVAHEREAASLLEQARRNGR